MAPCATGVAAAARIGHGNTGTSTFTYTFRLDVSPYQAEALECRFDAARRLFPACLAECRNRARRMRESRLWTHSCTTADSQQRSALSRQARKEHAFRLYDLFRFVASLGHGEIGHHRAQPGRAGRGHPGLPGRGRLGGPSPRQAALAVSAPLRSLGGAEDQGIRLRTRLVPPAAGPLGGHEVRGNGLVLPVRIRPRRAFPRRRTSARDRACARAAQQVRAHPAQDPRVRGALHRPVGAGRPALPLAAGDEVVGWDLGVSSWARETQAKWAPLHAGLAGAADGAVYAWAQGQGAAVITFDEDLADRRSFAVGDHCGIVRLRVWPTTPEDTMAALHRLLEEVTEDELHGALVVVDRICIRVRPRRPTT